MLIKLIKTDISKRLLKKQCDWITFCANFVIIPTVPLPAINFFSVGVEEETVTLAWNNPDGVVHEYIVTYDPNTGNPAGPITLPVSANSLTIENLRAGSQYSFSIVSVAGNRPQDIQTVSEPVEIISGK